MQNPALNKGTGFTEAERDALKLRGLLPPRVFTIQEQEARILENFRQKTSALEKYIMMAALQDRNETLFYRTVLDNVSEMMPIIYTPTVGEACQKLGHIFRRARGLYISLHDRGKIRDVLENWPRRDVDVIVVTDGERILGLGDLGAQGMGIPIGKLSLYTALAGIHPQRCLPITLDVGTNNAQLLSDSLYFGILQKRARGDEYAEFVDEFVMAVQRVFPGVVLQFEDFATENAIHLLETYRNRICTFNDDIQGTAGVTLAGLLAANRLTKRPLQDEQILFYGAGEAASGIGNLIVSAIVKQGITPEQARSRIWFVDSKGLVVRSRTDLARHKLPYAHEHEGIKDLEKIVEALRPTCIIGVSGQPQTFTEQILHKMGEFNERPMVFSLSNPTANSECTAEQAYRYTDGRAIFASGSPFPPCQYDGKTFIPGQGNNAYIFPGLGLGVIASRAKHVTDEMFYIAASTLAHMVTEEYLAQGTIFPPLERIREVSHAIGTAVAQEAYDTGLATAPRPKNLSEYVRSLQYEPEYEMYL
ncbi:MAG: NAD-dependent malic enzyme [Gemmatimonadota bacterium]|nr:NAD-dependent malic enzyme [Gemmatimonadota bacterium]MDH4350084.1 NAD-dependent malic enzyme [Gemmatimonadota bacterium]MDH5198722.1 NAD-dependent malic enzyme [Gemmatimonadota bacterium]